MFCDVLLTRELFFIRLIDATQAGLRGGLSVVVYNNLADIGRRCVEDLSWKFILQLSTSPSTVNGNDEPTQPWTI